MPILGASPHAPSCPHLIPALFVVTPRSVTSDACGGVLSYA